MRPPRPTLLPLPRGPAARWAPALLVALLAAAVYGRTVSFEYAYDDMVVITENRFTQAGLAGWRDILTREGFAGFFPEGTRTVAGGRYRPLAQLSFALEHQLFGLCPAVGHAVNVALYALLCATVLRVLGRLFPSRAGGAAGAALAAWGALIFAVHPLHTEVVANVKGRDELLCMLLALWTLLAALRFVDEGLRRGLALAGLWFALALLAKENAATFLVAVPLTLWFFRRPSRSQLGAVAAALGVPALLYLAARRAVLGTLTVAGTAGELLNDPYLHATPGQFLATNVLTWGTYLKLLFFPQPLTHDYYPWHVRLTTFADPRVLLSLAACAGLAVWALARTPRRDPLAWAVLYFWVTFSATANLFFNVGTFMSERFMFLPSLGFAAALPLALARLVPRRAREGAGRGPLLAAAVLALVLLAGQSIHRSGAWRDDLTLFTTDAATSRDSIKVNVTAGALLADRADRERDPARRRALLAAATAHLERAISLHPSHAAAWFQLGNARRGGGDLRGALDAYRRSLKLDPRNPDALNNTLFIAQEAQRTGRRELADEAFRLVRGLAARPAAR